MPLLEINNLNAFYGQVHAVEVKHLCVEEGECVVLIGANGAGKSSVLRSISRVISTTGSIVFRGEDLASLSPRNVIRKGIVHCPEGRHLFPKMSVVDNLRMGAFLQTSRRDVDERLEYVYEVFPILRERAEQSAGTLSGGEQQMCAVARSLMSRPVLLLLDEPSFGLAPIMVKRIMKVTRQLNSDGLAVVLVEQNASVALKVGSRGYVVEGGTVVHEGSAGELRGNSEVRRSYLGVA